MGVTVGGGQILGVGVERGLLPQLTGGLGYKQPRILQQQNKMTEQRKMFDLLNNRGVRNINVHGAFEFMEKHETNPEFQGERNAFLKMSSGVQGDVLISGSTDYSKLATLRNAMLELKNSYFDQSSGLNVRGPQRDQLDRRFLLIEHELDGLLRRKIESTHTDFQNGTRTMDFTTLLNEKEYQIVELETKIKNLESRLTIANKREIELESQVVSLKAENLTLRDKNFTGDRLAEEMRREARYSDIEKKFDTLVANFSTAASLWQKQLEKLSARYNDKFVFDREIMALLQQHNVKTYPTDGITTLEVHSQKTLQVPVQDTKTKQLIYLLTTNLRALSLKYPKLLSELDERLIVYFQQEMIQSIEIDSIDRIVQIVKFVPQTVRVQNIYAYSSEKSRKVQFHLRVLIKALLEQLQTLKNRNGLVLEMDEGVLGMINEEIMGVVNVDDILKVFRPAAKIVEVEKIVQKIVERIITVPEVVTVDRYIEKVVEVPRMVQIERIVRVPFEVVKLVEVIKEKVVQVPVVTEKIIQIPQIMQKIVERIVKEIQFIEVEKVVEKVIIQTEVMYVDRVNNVIQTVYEEVPVEKEKIVMVPQIIEKIVEVPTIVQRIIEKVIEVPQLVAVDRIVEKIVKVIEYQIVDQNKFAVQERIKEVEVIVERPVMVQRIVERIKEVPRIIERPVAVKSERVELREVQVIVQKIVYVTEVREVEKIKNVLVPVVKEVEKIVDRRVDVPIVQERIVVVPEYITKVVIERVEVTKVVPYAEHHDRIVYETKILEVEQPVVHYLKDYQIVNVEVDRIVEVPRTIERIKEVKTRHEKIVEKLVQVPKVVEVERIVEKIVVVPRIIERIVEVPKIVEVIVEKLVEKTVIKEVEKIVNKVVVKEQVVEVEKVRNVYHEVEKPVQSIREVIVPVENFVEKQVVVQSVKEKVITLNKEVPKEIVIDRIVTNIVEVPVEVVLNQDKIVVVEVPMEVSRLVEKAVKVVEYEERLVTENKFIERIVQKLVQTQIPIEVVMNREKAVEVIRTKVEKENQFIVQEKIKEIQFNVEKLVPVKEVIRQQVPVNVIVEKIVEVVRDIPKLVTVERVVENLIIKREVVQLQKVVPHIVKVYEVVKAYEDRIIPVIQREEVIKEVVVERTKNFIQHDVKTEVKQVEVSTKQIVEVDRWRDIVQTKNVFEPEIKEVQVNKTTSVPIHTVVEKIIEVPRFIEKIVERVVMIPQVVEVVKHIHEVVESDSLGVAVTGDLQVQETNYRTLYGQTKSELELLLTELRRIASTNVQFKRQIEIIEKFLIQFDSLAKFQRIIAVPTEKIVEREVNKAVLVPTRDSISIRNELSQALLIEKLVNALKAVRKTNSTIQLQLDEDVRTLFFHELYDEKNKKSDDFLRNLKVYIDGSMSKFSSLGQEWGNDHEFMLHSVLQDRFAMASLIQQSNLEIEKVKSIYDEKSKQFVNVNRGYEQLRNKLNEIHESLKRLYSDHPEVKNSNNNLSTIFSGLGAFLTSTIEQGEVPTIYLGEFTGSGNEFNRYSALIREKDFEIDALRSKILSLQEGSSTKLGSDYRGGDLEQTILSLKSENSFLKRDLERASKSSNGQDLSSTVHDLQMQLKTVKSENELLKSRIRTFELAANKDSRVTGSNYDAHHSMSEVQMVSSQYSVSSDSSKRIDDRSPSYDAKSIGNAYQPATSSYSNSSAFENRSNVSSDLKAPSPTGASSYNQFQSTGSFNPNPSYNQPQPSYNPTTQPQPYSNPTQRYSGTSGSINQQSISQPSTGLTTNYERTSTTNITGTSSSSSTQQYSNIQSTTTAQYGASKVSGTTTPTGSNAYQRTSQGQTSQGQTSQGQTSQGQTSQGQTFQGQSLQTSQGQSSLGSSVQSAQFNQLGSSNQLSSSGKFGQGSGTFGQGQVSNVVGQGSSVSGSGIIGTGSSVSGSGVIGTGSNVSVSAQFSGVGQGNFQAGFTSSGMSFNNSSRNITTSGLKTSGTTTPTTFNTINQQPK